MFSDWAHAMFSAPQSEISMSQMKKVTSAEATDSAALMQDNIPLSEMDKAAVLTLIREEVLYVTPTHPA